MPTAPITPMPEMVRGKPVVLVGGTFDPPHRAHTALAAAARAAVAPTATLVFVPAARSPLKEGGPEASGADRAEMLRLALAGVERAAVWTDELDRAEAGEASYWVVTLRRARALLGADQRLLFLIGADQALSFDRWHEPAEILRLAEAVVINRGEIRTREELAARVGGTDLGQRLIEAWCEVPRLEISATDVRRAIGQGDDTTLRAMLHEDVVSFIKACGLYAV